MIDATAEPYGSDPNCANKAKSAGTIIAYYDPESEKVNLVATLNDGSFAGWGWGGSMTNTEMVIFETNGDSNAISFHYGIGDDYPPEDSALAACYETSSVDNGDGTITFTAARPLECAGITDYGGGSYVVQLDAEMSLCMAWNPDKGSLSFHDDNL